MTPRRFVTDILPFCAWLAVIFTLSTGAGAATHTNSGLDRFLAQFFPAFYHRLTWPQLDALHYYLRKAAHVTEYAVLGILAVRAFLPDATDVFRKTFLFAWIFCTLYAATDEMHQIFVPGRTPKVTDVLLDSVGSALGVALMAVFLLRRRLKGSPTLPAHS